MGEQAMEAQGDAQAAGDEVGAKEEGNHGP